MQNVDIFNNKSFLGSVTLDDLLNQQRIISVGTILVLNEKKYCVDNIILKRENLITIEVT